MARSISLKTTETQFEEMSPRQFLFASLVSWCLLSSTQATCNVCNSVNNLTCYSSTQMQACDASGTPTGSPTDCPTGYVCVSGTGGVLCEPEDSTGGSQADCQECNKCDSSQTFACTGTSTFALCLGTDTVQNSTGTCADGYVCNINDTQICGLSSGGVSSGVLKGKVSKGPEGSLGEAKETRQVAQEIKSWVKSFPGE